MECKRSGTKATYRSTIAAKTDEVLLLNLQNISDEGRSKWYEHKSTIHRYYMRQCREEALRRGLTIPDFNPYMEKS